MENQLLITIIIISSCFFVGSLILDHGKWIVNAACRGGLGILMIGLINAILSGFGWMIPVGVNFFNFVIITLLGFPGLFALYGIGLWQIFR